MGVYVKDVLEDGAAEKGGLIAGDIITAVNGSSITTRAQLQKTINSYRYGTTVTITYSRFENGSYVIRSLTIGSALEIGIAYPIPSTFVPEILAELIPITSPLILSNAPPLFPGLIAASVSITSKFVSNNYFYGSYTQEGGGSGIIIGENDKEYLIATCTLTIT